MRRVGWVARERPLAPLLALAAVSGPVLLAVPASAPSGDVAWSARVAPSAIATAPGPSAAPGPSPASGPSPAPGPSLGAAASGGPSPRAAGCAATTLARMSLAERAGQVLMIGVPASRPDAGARVVRREQVGGLFLRGRTAVSPAVLGRRTAVVQRIATGSGGPGLHIAVDQEGGLVRTLVGPGVGDIPTATEQGSWDAADLRRRSAGWAGGLRAAGVTVNLAPVADTVPAGAERVNPPVGAVHRHFGHAPADVAQGVTAVVEGMQATGVIATLKHFPGLGRVRANTDDSVAAVDPATSPSDSSLAPFRSGIRAGAEAVMISSARYPRLGPGMAVFSREVVTGLLRERLGFTGLVVSDDLGSAVAVRSVPVGQRAVRFVAAGGDLVLTNRSADAGPMRTSLLAEARRSPAFRQRLSDAAAGVLASKSRHHLLACP